jgi:hypothetical protein
VPPLKVAHSFLNWYNMVDASLTLINAVSVHAVGNKLLGEELVLSDDVLQLGGDKIRSNLLTYFFSSFNSPEYHCFNFDNEGATPSIVYPLIKEIFADPELLHDRSIDLAKHLYEVSQHHHIKSGDLFVGHFSGIVIERKTYDVVGLFKCETKESYLKLKKESGSFKLSDDEGINIRKLDKGCIILNDNEAEGYRVLVVDNTNKSDANFWKNAFLGVSVLSDAFHHTHNFMNLTRQFVGDQLDEEFSVSKADKIDLLNKSMDFFKSREQFNQHEFEAEVLEDPTVIESFRKYEKNFMSDQDIVDNFEISAQAVKRQARVFKSVLKLDKNFHIYIHGNRDLIEKGFDEVKNRHYYKIYFDEES